MTSRRTTGLHVLAGRLNRRPERSPRDEDTGFSLVELLVTTLIMAVVLSMTIIIISTFMLQSANTQRLGLASENGQNALAQVDQYLRSAVSPANVQSAASSSGSSAACWGATSPSPVGGVPLTQNQTQSLAIVTAHDFDIWFCGFKNGDAQPHVFEIGINPTLCSNQDPRGGYCTLQVIDHGHACVPGQGSGLAGTASSCLSPGTTPTGQVIMSLSNVWCDQYCQGANNTAFSETYAMPPGNGPVTTSVAVACQNQRVPPAGGCSQATPPMFSYYLGTESASGGATGGQCSGSSKCNSTPVNPLCAADTCVLPSSVCTVNCVAPLDLTPSAVSPTGGSSATNVLLDIELVTVSFTAGAPATSSQTVTNGDPGAPFSNQIFLVNQVNRGYQACPYDQALSGVATPDSNWQMTDTGASGNGAPVVDSSAFNNAGTLGLNTNQAGGVTEGVQPGPLSCNVSSPAMKFPGSSTTYMQTTDEFCASSILIGSAACPPTPTGPQAFSVIAWFSAPSTSTSQGILGFGNTQASGSPMADRMLSIDAQGDLNWSVCAACISQSVPSVVKTTTTVNDGHWHMAVATVGSVSATEALVPGGGGQYLYVDGVLAGSSTATQAWNFAGWWQVGDDPSGVLGNFAGTIGRVTVIPQVLTPDQVAQLYDDSGSEYACSAGPIAAGQPVGFYPVGPDDTSAFAGGTAELHDHAPYESGVKSVAYPATVVNAPAPVSGAGPVVPTSAQGGGPALCNPSEAALPLNVSSNSNTYVDLGVMPGGVTQSGGAFGPSWPPANTIELSVSAWVNVASYSGGQDVNLVADSNTQCTDQGFQLVIRNGGGSGYFSVGNGTAPSSCDSFGQDSAPNYTDNAHDGNASWTADTANCAGQTGTSVLRPTICPEGSQGYWYNVVGTYDGNTVRVYVNGSEVASVPYTGSVALPATASTCAGRNDVMVGYNPQSCTGYLKGYVANVAVYQTTLTGQQVQDIYEAGSQA